MSPIARANSQSQVIVLSILHSELTPTQAAKQFGVSRKWIYQLLARYSTGGLEALEPRSRRPKTNPRALSLELRAQIIALRRGLLAQGLDAGAASIAWHLAKEHGRSPALSTIWASCGARASSHRSRRSDPRHISNALKQCNQMKPGNLISHIGVLAMGPMLRSSTGSMITHGCF